MTSALTILPTMLILLIGMDILYMFISTFLLPLMIVVTKITDKNVIQPFEDCLDGTIQSFLAMSYMDVKGFRS